MAITARLWLWDRAFEIAGHEHPFLCHLQAAHGELVQAGGLEPEPEDERGPVARPQEPQPTPRRRGGVFVVDPAVRAELWKIPLEDLRRRANVDRWHKLSPEQAQRLRQDLSAL